MDDRRRFYPYSSSYPQTLPNQQPVESSYSNPLKENVTKKHGMGVGRRNIRGKKIHKKIKQPTTKPFFLLLFPFVFPLDYPSTLCCRCVQNGRRRWGCYRRFLLAGSRGRRWSERIFIVLRRFRRLHPVVDDVVGSCRWRDLLFSQLIVAVIERIAIWSESIFFRLVVARGRAPSQVSILKCRFTSRRVLCQSRFCNANFSVFLQLMRLRLSNLQTRAVQVFRGEIRVFQISFWG